MADLVRNHVGPREIAGGMQLVLQLLEERHVEIDLLVARTVERPDRGGGATACGIHATAEQVEFGVDVGHAFCLENRPPGLLGRMQDRADEILLLRIDLCRRAVLHGRAGWHAALVQQGQRVLEEYPADDRQHHDRAQAHAATATKASTTAATVDLDVAAAATFSPIHTFPR